MASLPTCIERILRTSRSRNQRESSTPPTQTERYWAEAFQHGGIMTWMSEPRCRECINAMVSGSPGGWPMDCSSGCGRQPAPFELGLSLGCGDGGLERVFRRKSMCSRTIGVDLSETALEIAAGKAREEALDSIEYEVADLSDLALPREQYDIVFFHQAMHHVANVEGCTATIEEVVLDLPRIDGH
jgi:hypothetical protein